jgi:hypothetical protein
MSVFRTLNIACPACGGETPFDLVHSVNADRRADLRDEILAATFQQMPCPGCGKQFRVEPEFNYTNLGRNQWIAAWPRASMADWRQYDAQARESFDEAFGEDAPPGAQEMGRNIVPRITFGWAALREKLFVRDAGLDDVTVELAKAALIRASPTARIMSSELRLLAVEGEELVFGWIDSKNEQGIEINRVNRALLSEIEADPTTWEALRTQLSGEMFVDINRLFLPQSEDEEEEETTKKPAGKKKKGAAGKSSGKKSGGKASSSKKKKK